MAVTIGSARGSYGNTARGDQSGGKEVSTQSWYLHSKGWRVFRAKDPTKRALLAQAMKAACANNLIGYSQPDRLALYNQVKSKGYDPSKATEKTNTDCSALVRVCCWFAGIQVSNFTTADEPAALMKTGEFVELTDSKYTTKSDYLLAGDILDTKTKGHTVIVLTNGSKAYSNESIYVVSTTYSLGERTLKNGSTGSDVKDLQAMLIDLGYDCGKWGADGDFGDCTEMAVRAFQSGEGLKVDGIVGAETLEKLFAKSDDAPDSGTSVKIVGGNCYIRKEPNTSATIIGTAYNGNTYVYANETSEAGWLKILNHSTVGWVSGKYGKRG